ncbi:unnamed protein product [Effrenium voratum]|nr:unnamed protein product [Effrenium voratum]
MVDPWSLLSPSHLEMPLDPDSEASPQSVPPPPTVPDAWLPNKLRKRQGLLDYADVPTRQKVPFILWGYRPPPQGLCELLRTVFGIHNETGNMWSHLLGLLYCAWVSLDLVSKDQAAALWLLLLVAASAYCFFCSFFYHLCSCTGASLRECTYRLDLTGIVVLITASYFTGIALGYRCYPALRSFYLVYAGLVSVALSLPLMKPLLVKDMTRHLILCVAAGLVPAVHFTCVATDEEIGCVLPYLIQMFGFYGMGAWFYVRRWPEWSYWAAGPGASTSWGTAISSGTSSWCWQPPAG